VGNINYQEINIITDSALTDKHRFTHTHSRGLITIVVVELRDKRVGSHTNLICASNRQTIIRYQHNHNELFLDIGGDSVDQL